jgi:ubiquinone/menaquinone biosynthesis C-methylase UbiE
MSRESIVTVSRKWNKRVERWHDHVTSAEAFRKVLDRILVLSQPRGSDVCVDLGAGTGFVTTALAPLVASVLAVDISPAMTDALAERAADAGLANVSTEVADLKDFRLPPSHADLIVSSYALHHLADADKRALTARAARGLRPGGRLVIADMMFGRGRSRRDRAILRQKAAALAAKGIGGWWRIAKNLTRYGLRVGPERPATPEFWQQALRDAGLAEVRFHPVAAEAGIVCGVRQRSSLRHEAGRRLRAAGRISGWGQNREEIPGPSGEVLVGWTVLARYSVRGNQSRGAPYGPRDVGFLRPVLARPGCRARNHDPRWQRRRRRRAGQRRPASAVTRRTALGAPDDVVLLEAWALTIPCRPLLRSRRPRADGRLIPGSRTLAGSRGG